MGGLSVTEINILYKDIPLKPQISAPLALQTLFGHVYHMSFIWKSYENESFTINMCLLHSLDITAFLHFYAGIKNESKKRHTEVILNSRMVHSGRTDSDSI